MKSPTDFCDELTYALHVSPYVNSNKWNREESDVVSAVINGYSRSQGFFPFNLGYKNGRLTFTLRKSRISDASRSIAGMMREFVSSGYDRFAWVVDYKAALRNAAAWVGAYVERFGLCVPAYGNDGSSVWFDIYTFDGEPLFKVIYDDRRYHIMYWEGED